MNLLLKNVRLPLAPFTLAVDAEIHGLITAIFGPSGSGKTSLLEIIAGLRKAQSAFIQLENCVLVDTASGVFLPPRRRGIGYVPQDLALFPHLSVRQNLLYGHGLQEDGPFSFEHIIQLLELEPLIRRRVPELSGGEQQRVALGRALLTSPRLLLLDEPLASLDSSLKTKILPYLRRIRDECQVPMLYVTHDRFETVSLADHMLVLARGKLAQSGSVQEVFNRPANLEVAGIVAVETIQSGRIIARVDGLIAISIAGTVVYSADPEPFSVGNEVYVCIRAEEVVLFAEAVTPGSPRNRLPAVVRSVNPLGPLMRVDLDCGFPLVALLTRRACDELSLQPGGTTVAYIKAPHVHLIAR